VSRPPENPANSSPDPSEHGFGSQNGRDPSEPSAGGRPRAIVVIALIAVAEATALLVAAGWYAYGLASGAPVQSFWGAVFTLGLLLAFSAWLYAVGHFLFRGYRWTRAAALVAQLFVLTIGFPTLTGGLVLAGSAMLVPAAAAVVLLFDKRVISYASRTGGSPPAL
jgi:hypothetical protein